MSDIKAMYRTVMADHFPPEMTITFGDQKLVYRKRTWKLPDSKGEVIEMGLRYGENPGQEAALYELAGGNLTLGGCHFLDPGNGLTSAIDEAAMVQAGKHPGKTNLTDLDNGLNIIKYLQAKPAAAILKHNNPCGAAWADSLAAAYDKANMADRIAAFGGCAVFNRPLDKTTAELVAQNYLEVVAAPDFEAGTLDILKKAKDLRIIKVPNFGKLQHLVHARTVEFKALIDGGLIVQQSPLNAILKMGRLQARRGHAPGQALPLPAGAHRPGIRRPALRLVGGAGHHLQLGDLRQRRLHRGHRHRRAGPGGGGRDRHLQGLYQVRRRPLLPALRHPV